MKKIALLVLVLAGLSWSQNAVWAKVERQKTIINREQLEAKMRVKVSAYIGGYLFEIEGLTSPWAKVNFFSTEGNLNLTTMANDKGIFRFHSVLAPLQTGDFCFLSYDLEGMANNPLCFSPPPPQTKTTIKGIVLAPSISLSQGVFRQGELVIAQGRTFPGAKIKIFLFEANQPLWQKLLDLIFVSLKKNQISSNHQQNQTSRLQIGMNHWWLSAPTQTKIITRDQEQTRKNNRPPKNFFNHFTSSWTINKANLKDKKANPMLTRKYNNFLKSQSLVKAGVITPPTNQAVAKLLKKSANRRLSSWLIAKKILDITSFFVKQVFAREGPQLTITADQEGRFSFNLPTQKSSRWRFFVAPQLNPEQPVAKSNTLEFAAFAWWQWFLIQLLSQLQIGFSFLWVLLFRWESVIILLLIAILLTAKRLL